MTVTVSREPMVSDSDGVYQSGWCSRDATHCGACRVCNYSDWDSSDRLVCIRMPEYAARPQSFILVRHSYPPAVATTNEVVPMHT